MSILPRIKLALTGLYWRYLEPHQRVFLSLVFVIVGVFLLVHGPAALAQGSGTDTAPVKIAFVPNFLLNILSRILLLISRLFLSVSMFILSFIIEIGGYNGYLSSQAVSIGWVTVRDITNMGFVIILLIIAFGTILGLEQYEWKKLLVKFVLAAVLVNFSRIICGIIIDIAQVVMTTFVNGIAATAGGNLINAFDLTGIQKFSAEGTNLNPDAVFIASVAAITFSAMVMATMAVYLFMMIARMVVLWVLIVLSPLAFVLSVVPQTQKFASEWWSEFGSNVVTGPVLLFFLWLSFVTVGSGNVHQQISDASGYKLNEADAGKVSADISSGITEAMKWNSMASFAIAIGMLIVGAKAAQQLGGVGGAWAGGAIDFGKKVATVASGVAAARWAGGKVKEGAIAGAKLAGKGLYAATIENTVERAKMRVEREIEGYRTWRAQGPRLKRTAVSDKKVAMAEGTELTEEEKKQGMEVVEEHGQRFKIQGLTEEEKARGVVIKQEDEGRFKYDFERGVKSTKMKEGEELTQAEKDRGVKMVEKDGERFKEEENVPVDTRSWVQKRLHERQERVIKSKKLLEKVKKQKTVREELMDKRVTADPTYFMQQFEGEKGTYRFNALDRMEQGQLEAEKARSAAKTKEFGGIGKGVVMANVRFKDQEWQGKRGSVAKQIATHEGLAHGTEAEITRLQSEETKKFFQTHEGHAVEVRTNLAEQAKQAAEDFVKGLKSEDLTKKFKDATAVMSGWLKEGPEVFAAKLKEAAAGKHGAYIAALGQSQLLKTEEEAAGIRRRQAEDAAHDAFVGKPRYGTTTASTALSDYSETKLKSYKQLDRAAAMKKAADMMASLMLQRNSKPLEIDQEAELFAASTFLTSEAWIDDQDGYMVGRFKALQGGKLEGEEKTKWSNMAKNLAQTGNWGFSATDLEADGTIKASAKIDGNYSRDRAGELQNLAITGGDTELVAVHSRIARRMDKGNADVEMRSGAVVQEQFVAAKKLKGRAAGMKDTDAEEHAKLEFERASEEDLKNFKQANDAAIRARQEEISREKVTYWQAAEAELMETPGSTITSKAALRARYEKYSDFLQDATKSHKANALATGHEELGYNQDFDEDEDVYRFQSFSEGHSKIRAERVKMKSRQLVNTDQYHSNGKLDQFTGVLDDFYEDVLNLSLGKVQKAIEMTDIPERSLKGNFYIHKNESASTIKKEGVEYAVVGGEAARKKFGEDGDTTAVKRLEHVLKRGMLPLMLAGEKGMALGASKLYGHTKEGEAVAGVINLSIEGEQFKTDRDMAQTIVDKIKNERAAGRNFLANTPYASQVSTVLRRLQQIIDKKAAAPERESRATADADASATSDDIP